MALNAGARQAEVYTDDLEGMLRLPAESPLMGPKCPEIAAAARRYDYHRHAIF